MLWARTVEQANSLRELRGLDKAKAAAELYRWRASEALTDRHAAALVDRWDAEEKARR